MIILGVDPGTATTGWAVVEEKNGGAKPLAFGHISTSVRKEAAERLEEIGRDVKKIVQKYKVREAAVEDIFFFKNLKTAIKVSEARGAILLTLQQQKIKITSYTPLQIKQALTGYGRAEKKQIQQMVKNVLKLKSIPRPDDAADALAIAICHLNSKKINDLE